jgi:hypothetical protein
MESSAHYIDLSHLLIRSAKIYLEEKISDLYTKCIEKRSRPYILRNRLVDIYQFPTKDIKDLENILLYICQIQQLMNCYRLGNIDQIQTLHSKLLLVKTNSLLSQHGLSGLVSFTLKGHFDKIWNREDVYHIARMFEVLIPVISNHIHQLQDCYWIDLNWLQTLSDFFIISANLQYTISKKNYPK